MTTLSALIDRHGVDVLDHLDRNALVPVVSGLQCQGDVAVVPSAMLGRPVAEATTAVPATGVAVVRGESGGNTHLLLAEGDVRYNEFVQTSSDLALGILTVADGATAYLAHPEHAYAGIGPGTYEIRRQREQADEIRLVMD